MQTTTNGAAAGTAADAAAAAQHPDVPPLFKVLGVGARTTRAET